MRLLVGTPKPEDRERDASWRDRGASPVELAILLPVIFVLLIAAIQAGAYFLARAVALNAAQVAVNSTRTLNGGSAMEGEQKAREFIANTPGWLTSTQVVVQKDEEAGQVTATVSGTALRLLPGVSVTVSQTAGGPLERFVPEE